MSASASADKCEPNLTPMLDMVLQLVMFFMLCANFLMEELNQAVRLPNAVSARPLDKNINKTIYLNMTADDKKAGIKPVISVSQGAAKEVFDPKQLIQLKRFLENQYKIDGKRTPAADWTAGKGRTTIILRADKELAFRQVNDVLQICKQSGYSDISLRAIQAGTEK